MMHDAAAGKVTEPSTVARLTRSPSWVGPEPLMGCMKPQFASQKTAPEFLPSLPNFGVYGGGRPAEREIAG
jgi:hypothetical protein